MTGVAGRPRIHVHLSREAIAQAALGLVDRRGLEALTVRSLARELGVGTATLYGHVQSKDEVVLDIVALLFTEVDSDPRPGEGWDDWLRRVAITAREMALRHPRAFPLFATAPDDQPPVLDVARSYMQVTCACGVAEEQALTAWQLVGGYLTGFLLQEAAEKVRALAAPASPAAEAKPSDALRERMARVHSAEAFATGLEALLAGLRQLEGMPA